MGESDKAELEPTLIIMALPKRFCDFTCAKRYGVRATRRLAVIALVVSVACLFPGVMSAATKQPPGQLTCGPFAETAVPKPAQQTDAEAVRRFELIHSEAKARPHTVVFLGDSLTQKWDRSTWQRNFADALNAGVNGDRTENLLWRINHGNLEGQEPDLAVLLIGTNDIGRNRPARIVAEGVRQILLSLRSRLKKAQILLLGILPRSESPDSERRHQVAEVNQLIRTCADHDHVFYADVGDALLDRVGRLTREVSPDGVHLSQHGYGILTDRLELEFGRLPPAK